MSAEQKFYPNTDNGRSTALSLAKQANDNVGANSPLTQRTKDRLNAIQPLFETRISERTTKEGELALLLADKEKAKEKTAMFCSHFVQVMNLCIKRGEYEAAIRAFYLLPVDSEQVYALKTEPEIQMSGMHLLQGEADRVAHGGVPMSRPSAAEVKVHHDLYVQLINSGSNAKTALRLAQKAVNELNHEADKVIRKVWAEVETFYNELPRAGQREHARRWGVVYGRKGHLKKITGTVTDSATGLPLTGVTIKLANGRNKKTTGSNGAFTITTTLMHGQTLLATLNNYEPYKTTIVLQEGSGSVCEVKMVRL